MKVKQVDQNHVSLDALAKIFLACLDYAARHTQAYRREADVIWVTHTSIEIQEYYSKDSLRVEFVHPDHEPVEIVIALDGSAGENKAFNVSNFVWI
jgi:hypothetical protein